MMSVGYVCAITPKLKVPKFLSACVPYVYEGHPTYSEREREKAKRKREGSSEVEKHFSGRERDTRNS